MNADILKGKWHELKGSLKTQWARLTDDDVTAIDGQVERLRGDRPTALRIRAKTARRPRSSSI